MISKPFTRTSGTEEYPAVGRTSISMHFRSLVCEIEVFQFPRVSNHALPRTENSTRNKVSRTSLIHHAELSNMQVHAAAKISEDYEDSKSCQNLMKCN